MAILWGGGLAGILIAWALPKQYGPLVGLVVFTIAALIAAMVK